MTKTSVGKVLPSCLETNQVLHPKLFPIMLICVFFFFYKFYNLDPVCAHNSVLSRSHVVKSEHGRGLLLRQSVWKWSPLKFHFNWRTEDRHAPSYWYSLSHSLNSLVTKWNDSKFNLPFVISSNLHPVMMLDVKQYSQCSKTWGEMYVKNAPC